MASIVLGSVGSVVGGAIGGPFGAAFGAGLGRVVGGALDGSVFGSSRSSEGARLADLSVQTSTYGAMIPVLYGTSRIAGNVIWSRPIRETATTTTTSVGGKGGSGGGAEQKSTSYSYDISLAISICEGPIDEVVRVWADSKLLDLSQGTYRVYLGHETQLPDPLIESFEGVSRTPAYRGQAYVVIENFPLAAFGNRVPNFTFEVRKTLLPRDVNGQPLEHTITSMIMIPGSGEFVYDTDIQFKVAGQDVAGGFARQGTEEPVNAHNTFGMANGMLSTRQLKKTCPNLQWVGLVVTWFGNSLNAAECTVQPGVEYKNGATTRPDTWQVAGYDRNAARQITLVDGSPRYGGTPDDSALLRYIAALKAQGWAVMLYPMFFMDMDQKPWRGRVTGSNTAVDQFFTKTNGYNAFITHYANLCKNKVDAFVIGSELVGLTKVSNGNGNFPAVNRLVNLAATVKGIMGPGTALTYAADWSEYHHTDSGWYHLDPLWASPHISMVGIDAYFPLTDSPQDGYDPAEIVAGWDSGEGYDFYYSDTARTVQTSLQPAYAWKNIGWWWSNFHQNPNGTTTAWMPGSKPIWFTEYGFPSVDGAANQPNVFYDEESSEGAFPCHSNGQMDILAQRQALVATELRWRNSPMVTNRFVWTWDARPYPYWPDLRSVWADGDLWQYGHWVQGKLGRSGLAAIVRDLCLRAGVADAAIDVARLEGIVQGFVLNRRQTVRQCIEQLQDGFFFDALESDHRLKFVPRGQPVIRSLTVPELVSTGNDDVLEITRGQEVELPASVDVITLNPARDYQRGSQVAQRDSGLSQQKLTLELPIVMDAPQAAVLAEASLYSAWISRTGYQLKLPPRFLGLEPADVITCQAGTVQHQLRILRTQLGTGHVLAVEAVADDPAALRFPSPKAEETIAPSPTVPLASTTLRLLDLPLLPGRSETEAGLVAAAAPTTRNWRGAVFYRSADQGENYSQTGETDRAAVIGTCIDTLGPSQCMVIDDSQAMIVAIESGELFSCGMTALLNGANAALVGREIIQFREATPLEPGRYRLQGLLRGRLGTEHEAGAHGGGEPFTLLDERLMPLPMGADLLGLERLYKAVTIGATLGSAMEIPARWDGAVWRPYSPVHLSARKTGGDIQFGWIRRTRIDGAWRDGVETALGEQEERYRVDILAGNTLKRSWEVTLPAATYTAAQQTADFGTVQSAVSVRVAQLSARIGAGTPALATFTFA